MSSDVMMTGSPDPPHQLSPPLSPASQSDIPTKRMKLSVTIKNPTTTPTEFNALQHLLLNLIYQEFPSSTFLMNQKDGTQRNRDSLPPVDFATAFPVSEIIVKTKRETLISIHDIETNLKPHEIRSNEAIDKFLVEHEMGLRKHYWDDNQVDIVCPFFILTQDPRFTLEDDVLKHLKIPPELLDELEAMHIKAVPTTCSQTKKNDPIKAQMFALECSRKHSTKVIAAVHNHLTQKNVIFLPSKFKYTNKKAWDNGIRFQRDLNRHTKCISITNLNDNQVQRLRAELAQLPGVYGLYARYRSNPFGAWNIRVRRQGYKETLEKIEAILTTINGPTAAQNMIYITRGRLPESENPTPWDLKSFYTSSSKSFASIKFDSVTGEISEITEPTIQQKPKKQRSYLQASTGNVTSDKERIRELEAEVVRLKKQLGQQTSTQTVITEQSNNTDSLDSLKEEMRTMMVQQTKILKEWVIQRMTHTQPETQECFEPDIQLKKTFAMSSLERASGRGRGRGCGVGRGLHPGPMNSARKVNPKLQLVAALARKTVTDAHTENTDNSIIEYNPPIAQFENSLEDIPQDIKEIMMDPASSLTKRSHEEANSTDSRERPSVARINNKSFRSPKQLFPTINSDEKDHFQEAMKQLVAEASTPNNQQDNTVDVTGDPLEDPESFPRESHIYPRGL